MTGGPRKGETEVYRLCKFHPDKFYSFAFYTRREGRWPNERHYTTHKLLYLGKHVGSESWGCGDGSGGAEEFDNKGKLERIEYDYEGTTCFVEHDCDQESIDTYTRKNRDEIDAALCEREHEILRGREELYNQMKEMEKDHQETGK
mgnify:CR=1 FL=1